MTERVTPSSEHDWSVHSLNIHGTFFERKCRSIVDNAVGWRVVACNFPVQARSKHNSSLDLWVSHDFGDKRYSLLIECKKNKPDLSNWVFFLADRDRDVNLSFASTKPTPEASKRWDTTLTVSKRNGGPNIADDGREVRANYQAIDSRTRDKTRTSNATIQEAAFQVTTAFVDLFRKEKLHNDQLARSGASRPRLSVHILQPVIVTTATLFLCDFDPAFVDLETGEIDFDKVTLQPASGLVYNYPLHADLQFDVGNFIEALDTQALPAASRSSIRVVQSLDFPDYLARAAVWFDDLWSDRVHIADDDSTPADVVPVTPPSN